MPFYVLSPLDGTYSRLVAPSQRELFPKAMVFRASNNNQAKDLVGVDPLTEKPYRFLGNLEVINGNDN